MDDLGRRLESTRLEENRADDWVGASWLRAEDEKIAEEAGLCRPLGVDGSLLDAMIG